MRSEGGEVRNGEVGIKEVTSGKVVRRRSEGEN